MPGRIGRLSAAAGAERASRDVPDRVFLGRVRALVPYGFRAALAGTGDMG
jgi:hypothetical protein